MRVCARITSLHWFLLPMYVYFEWNCAILLHILDSSIFTGYSTVGESIVYIWRIFSLKISRICHLLIYQTNLMVSTANLQKKVADTIAHQYFIHETFALSKSIIQASFSSVPWLVESFQFCQDTDICMKNAQISFQNYIFTLYGWRTAIGIFRSRKCTGVYITRSEPKLKRNKKKASFEEHILITPNLMLRCWRTTDVLICSIMYWEYVLQSRLLWAYDQWS